MLNRHSIAGLLVCGIIARAAAAPEATPRQTARDYLVHVWQTDNGLPQNWVSSFAQTPDGYLWIGTRYGGLARFDGVRFVPFNQQNTPELKDVQVERLSVDAAGRLWVIMGNESITAFQDGRAHLFRWPRTEPRLRVDHVLSMHSNEVLFAGELPYLPVLNLAKDTNGWALMDPRATFEADPTTFVLDRSNTVWFVTRGQRLGHFEKGRFEVARDLPGLPEATATALAVDAAGELWVATPHHLGRWDGKSFADSTPTNGTPPERILQLAFSGDGGLWVLEKNRLRKCLNGQWVAEASPKNLLPSDAPGTFSLHGDSRGNAWLVNNGHGLWHIKGDGSANLLTEKTGLPSALITCWFQDAEGDIWIGTAGGGIARIRETLFHALGQADGLPGKVVCSVCVDGSGTLWAGMMSGGLAHWKDGRFEPLPLPAPGSSAAESVTVFPGTDGGMWIGTLNHGLMRLREGKIARAAEPGWDTIRVIFGDSRGRVWVGGLVGLMCLDNGEPVPLRGGEGYLDSHAIGAVAEDVNRDIWVGTGPGDLWKFSDNKFTRFTPPAQWPSVRISAVLPDTNGVVWVGTLGGGLLRFCNGEFTRCTKANGLPDDNISQLLDSRDGHLWAGTYAGIFRASKDNLEAVAAGRVDRVTCRVYGRFDGLPAMECSSGFQPSCWRSLDGRLYFSTANGVVSVEPLGITENRAPPTVVIEEMLVDGRQHDLPSNHPAANAKAKPLEIGPGRHYVQFRFTGLNFTAPDGVRFRVKLEGVDRDWQSAGGQRLIGYGPLLPGDYEFRVIACNNEGLWNEEGDTLHFKVLPYFWETWWFRAGLSITTLALLGITVAVTQRQRYRRRLERVERQREMEGERTRIAQDLHDDLGTSLTQISMLSALANREQTPPEEAKELIQQVRGRAREMVTALDEIVWAVNPKNDSINELVNYLAHFSEQFFRPTSIRCRLDLPDDVPPHSLSAEARHHLFLAFKEAINNAARHSQATQVIVRIVTFARELVISVEDDGRGIGAADAAAGRVGNGLINMRDRMKQMGGRAEVQSTPGSGTKVALHFPLE